MRAILGKPDCPDSSYILILRGLDTSAMDYLHFHTKKYATWGCLVFPEKGENLPSLKDTSLTPIHKMFTNRIYIKVSDDTLIKWVKEAFPPFSEDEMEPSCGAGISEKDSKRELLMDAIKGSFDAIRDLSKTIGDDT